MTTVQSVDISLINFEYRFLITAMNWLPDISTANRPTLFLDPCRNVPEGRKKATLLEFVASTVVSSTCSASTYSSRRYR